MTISGGWNDWLFEAFAIQNGDLLMDYRNQNVRLNSPAALEALEFWVKLTQELKVAPPHSTWASTPTDFVAGRTAMLYHTTGVLTFIRTSAQFPYGVAFMPAKKSYGAAVGGGNLHISKNIPEENKQAAWRFIEFLTTPEMAARWSRDSGYVATRIDCYDVRDEGRRELSIPWPANSCSSKGQDDGAGRRSRDPEDGWTRPQAEDHPQARPGQCQEQA